MSVDKFGRQADPKLSQSSRLNLRGPKGDGFTLTPEGDFSLDNKRLTLLQDPRDDSDAATLRFVKNNFLYLEPKKGYISAGKKRIANISDPIDGQDAASKSYVDRLISQLQKQIDSVSSTLNPSTKKSNSSN